MTDGETGRGKGLLDKLDNWIMNSAVMKWVRRGQVRDSIRLAILNAETLEELEKVHDTYKPYIEEYADIKALYDIKKRKLEDKYHVNWLTKATGETVENVFKGIFESPAVSAVKETLGGIAHGAFVEPLEVLPPYERGKELSVEEQYELAKKGIREYLGTSIAITSIPAVANMLAEVGTAGQLDKIADSLNSVYFATGLNWMTWTMLSEMIRNNLNIPMERYYNYKYRPTRMSLSQLMDAYASGLKKEYPVRYEMQQLGWRDEDIDIFLKLATKRLSLSMLLDAYAKNVITENELAERLRLLGYSAEDAEIIMKTYVEQKQEETRRIYLSKMEKAFKEGLIEEAKYRQYLAELGYAEDDINLMIQLAKLDMEEKVRSVTKSQLDKAYKEQVIDEVQYRKEMLELGYTEDAIQMYLKTMDAELKPKFRQINVNTLKEAYKKAVISEGQFKAKMRELGYKPEDVDIIIKTMKETGEKVEKQPSISALMSAVRKGIITPVEMKKQLMQIGYSEEVASMYVRLATAKEEKKTRTLSKSEILKAFKKGLMDVEDAISRLMQLGYSPDDAELLLVMEVAE